MGRREEGGSWNGHYLCERVVPKQTCRLWSRPGVLSSVRHLLHALKTVMLKVMFRLCPLPSCKDGSELPWETMGFSHSQFLMNSDRDGHILTSYYTQKRRARDRNRRDWSTCWKKACLCWEGEPHWHFWGQHSCERVHFWPWHVECPASSELPQISPFSLLRSKETGTAEIAQLASSPTASQRKSGVRFPHEPQYPHRWLCSCPIAAVTVTTNSVSPSHTDLLSAGSGVRSPAWLYGAKKQKVRMVSRLLGVLEEYCLCSQQPDLGSHLCPWFVTFSSQSKTSSAAIFWYLLPAYMITSFSLALNLLPLSYVKSMWPN